MGNPLDDNLVYNIVIALFRIKEKLFSILVSYFITMANNQRNAPKGFGGGILGIVMILGTVMLLWFLFKSVYSILYFIAPVLFIATLFMKRSVFVDYAKFIGKTFQENAGKGLLYGIGTFVGFPVVLAYLFVKALTMYQFEKKFGKKEEPKFAEYEEVEEQEVDDEDFLELPEIEKAEPIKKSNNEYDDLL